MQSELRHPLVVILGPTAVGKTSVSIELARRFDGEIVSADSRLFYRGMDIGTAKPTSEEQQIVPHHLIDVTDPDQPWSLALFQKEASTTIHDIHRRKKMPFLVGGTGQYIKAVTEEWTVPPVEPDPKLRSILENWALEVTPQGLHERLAILDPQAAANIDYRNLRRTVRALEVIFRTGKQFSSLRNRTKSPYEVLKVGLTRPRSELYQRIDERIDAMIDSGLVEEIRNLLEKGYDPTLPAFSAIGYREIIPHLRGEINLEEAVALIKRNTRIFVRRQANWFKENDPQIHWFTMNENTVDEVEVYLRGEIGQLSYFYC